jgi:hypothetical protein
MVERNKRKGGRGGAGRGEGRREGGKGEVGRDRGERWIKVRRGGGDEKS